ncbi:hypothetical protein Acr_22g0007430 [Actinidia rufa]|uniref:Uncharacterized protein n=1 Tax=Actinidia rufa TaxID=165716 RepID=A0A7J0GKN8_9ERIC|nr:hypothetical protein Acr_22g0007430 [Actinidia rufa]
MDGEREGSDPYRSRRREGRGRRQTVEGDRRVWGWLGNAKENMAGDAKVKEEVVLPKGGSRGHGDSRRGGGVRQGSGVGTR